MENRTLYYWFIIFFTILSSCATSLYDHYTFTETITAKTEAESLIRQSVNSYQNYIPQIEAFKARVQKMSIYEREKDKNEITQKMWDYLNSEKSSLSKFLILWEEKDSLNPAFTEEFSKQISSAFDLMIEYESKKSPESQSALQQLLTAQ